MTIRHNTICSFCLYEQQNLSLACIVISNGYNIYNMCSLFPRLLYSERFNLFFDVVHHLDVWLRIRFAC